MNMNILDYYDRWTSACVVGWSSVSAAAAAAETDVIYAQRPVLGVL